MPSGRPPPTSIRKRPPLDEGARFPGRTAGALEKLCLDAGFAPLTVTTIEVETVFPDFKVFWYPFTRGARPTPGCRNSLSEEKRRTLKRHLADKLDTGGRVILPTRAWAVSANWSA